MSRPIEPSPPPSESLPEPSAEELDHSARLAAAIRADIAHAGGAIPFARFMELALYAPALGYYTSDRRKFGAGGDFVTAPELGAGLAHCLARQIRELFAQLGDGELLEVGAGNGRLAIDLLRVLAALDCLPRRYRILELSGALRARQEASIRAQLPDLHARIEWIERLPEPGFRGVVIANELLDALPVDLLRLAGGEPRELCVAGEGTRFVWRERAAGAALARHYAERLAPLALPDGYRIEVHRRAEAWVASIAERLAAGALLLIDYGFPRGEYFHPERRGGTLLCHYRHRVHADPLIRVGLQDITAHVDFSAVAEAADAAGLDVLGYASQSAFLLACGITDYAAAGDERERIRRAQEIKKLTLPHEMGELFKVMALGRNVAAPLAGFTLQDRRHRL
ncbi:MAG TPA: SAM-dependent methyltransferase [Acidiferrobacterales bacterium]